MKTSNLATDEELTVLLPREGERHLRTGWPPHRRNQSSRSFQTSRQPGYSHLASQVNESTAGDPHFFSVAFELAAQLLHDQQGKYPTVWAAVKSISTKLGCAPKDLYERANEYSSKNECPLQNINNTESGNDVLRALQSEVRELRQANEILKLARCLAARRATV